MNVMKREHKDRLKGKHGNFVIYDPKAVQNTT